MYIPVATKTYTYLTHDINTCKSITLWYLYYVDKSYTSATYFMESTNLRTNILFRLIIHLCLYTFLIQISLKLIWRNRNRSEYCFMAHEIVFVITVHFFVLPVQLFINARIWTPLRLNNLYFYTGLTPILSLLYLFGQNAHHHKSFRKELPKRRVIPYLCVGVLRQWKEF